MQNEPLGQLTGSQSRRAVPQHFDTDALSAFLDDRLDPETRGMAAAHLAACADCRRELDELRTTVTLLRGLPQYRPRRSFQLGAAYARPVHASPLARFLPFLPALRTATAVIALLFAVATAADVLIDSEDGNLPASTATTTLDVVPPANAREPTGREPLTEPGGASGAVTGDDADSAEPQGAAEETTGGQSATSSDGADDGGLSPWQVAQLALGLMLVGLIAALVAIQRLANRARRLDPGF